MSSRNPIDRSSLLIELETLVCSSVILNYCTERRVVCKGRLFSGILVVAIHRGIPLPISIFVLFRMVKEGTFIGDERTSDVESFLLERIGCISQTTKPEELVEGTNRATKGSGRQEENASDGQGGGLRWHRGQVSSEGAFHLRVVFPVADRLHCSFPSEAMHWWCRWWWWSFSLGRVEERHGG